MNKYQIGVMGSTADLKYTKNAAKQAELLGELIAKRNGILFFGSEKDSDSLSTATCRGAKNAGGLTVGITYGKGKKGISENPDIIIPCGLERGGGRELVLVLSCDAIIAISGGSGTLTELAIAYQADIPMIALSGFGGWSDKLADKFFDGRKRRKVLKTITAKQAVNLAFSEAKKYRTKYR